MNIESFDLNSLQKKLEPVEKNDPGWKQLWNGYFYSEKTQSQKKAVSNKATHKTTIDSIGEMQFETYCMLSILKNINKKEITFFELGAGWGRKSTDIAGIIDHKLINTNIENVKCIAVEAEPTHFRWLQEIFSYNNIKGYTLFGAMTDNVSTVKFDAEPDPADSYGQHIKESGNVIIPAFSIDYLIEIFKIDHVDIIHMDVQSEEYKVIKGAEKSIKEGKINYFIIGTHKVDLSDLIKEELSNYYDCIIDLKPVSGMHSIDGFNKPVNIPQDGIQVFKRK